MKYVPSADVNRGTRAAVPQYSISHLIARISSALCLSLKRLRLIVTPPKYQPPQSSSWFSKRKSSFEIAASGFVRVAGQCLNSRPLRRDVPSVTARSFDCCNDESRNTNQFSRYLHEHRCGRERNLLGVNAKGQIVEAILVSWPRHPGREAQPGLRL